MVPSTPYLDVNKFDVRKNRLTYGKTRLSAIITYITPTVSTGLASVVIRSPGKREICQQAATYVLQTLKGSMATLSPICRCFT